MKKILTDIEIPQSSTWVEVTTLAENHLRPGILKFMKKFFHNDIRIMRFLSVFLILCHMRKYDVVVNAPGKGAQLIAFIRAALKMRMPRQIILELMLDEESPSIKWRVKNRFQKFAFSSVDTIFVSSSDEVDTYSKRLGISRGKIKFLPFHTDIIRPEIIDRNDGFIFSAGKTGRDYRTFIEAIKGTDIQAVIVSDEYHLRGLYIPENIKVLINIPYDEYVEWLRKCCFVVVPLIKLVKSTGQVVILEAMGYGKPVIATETTGTVDYINNKHNGLLVPVNDPIALRSSIQKLINDKALYRKLAVNGLKTVIKHHTFEAYITAILSNANEI